VEPSSSVKLPVTDIGSKDRCNSMELSDLYLSSNNSIIPAIPEQLGSMNETQRMRGAMRTLIMSGDVDGAVAFISQHYQGMLKTNAIVSVYA
jgi:hypothetical protein